MRTWLSERFGLDVPVVSAPMAGAAAGELAAAVCRGGGLGMFGVGGAATPGWIGEQCKIARSAGRPFGVGLLAWLLDRNPGTGFLWLHSVEEPALALPVVRPELFFSEFALHMAPEDAEPLLDAYHRGIAALGAPFAGWASACLTAIDAPGLARQLDRGFVGLQLPATAVAVPPSQAP